MQIEPTDLVAAVVLLATVLCGACAAEPSPPAPIIVATYIPYRGLVPVAESAVPGEPTPDRAATVARTPLLVLSLQPAPRQLATLHVMRLRYGVANAGSV